MICTIYLLTNKVNNKIYIGQTWNPLNIRMGKNGRNYKNCIYLYNAIQKYGINNFIYTTLAYCEDQLTADKTENFFINFYKSRSLEIGYNLRMGGSVGKHSEETKEKISLAIKNKIWSEEALLKRKIAGKAWKGKKRGSHTGERKKKISEFSKNWHANNPHPFEGKHHSEESKDSIRKKLIGRKIDIESVRQGALKRMMDPERERAIITAYINGTPIHQISYNFGTGNGSIYRILKRNSIPLISKKYNK